MQPALDLSCASCGRPASAAPGEPFARCPRCAADGAPVWEVRRGAERLTLDRAAIADRVRGARLGPFDWVRLPGEPFAPLGASPDFRGLFVPGGPDELTFAAAAPATPAPRLGSGAPGRLLRAGALLLGLGAVAAAAAWFALQPAPPAPAPAPPVVEAVPVPTEAPPPVAKDVLAELAARVGPVVEPRETLVADAWKAWLGATPKGLAQALTLAERAVVAAPEDPEALALLAALVAETGGDAEVGAAALARAQGASASLPVVRWATARVALLQGRLADAQAEAERCVNESPADLACRAVLLETTDSGRRDPANVLYAYDELAREWPENKNLARRAAVVAAERDAPGAEARLAAARKALPGDQALLAAEAVLTLKNGDLRAGLALAGKVSPAPLSLALEAAAADLALGDGDAAARRLEGKVAPESPEIKLRLALLRVQAQILRARAGAHDAGAAASAAVEQLGDFEAGRPAVVQARALAARAAGKPVSWGRLDTRGATGRDIARLWLSQAEVALAEGRAPDAVRAADEAVAADPADPAVHLWRARARLAAQNAPGAIEALRDAVLLVDGSVADRHPVSSALAVSAPSLRGDLAAVLQDPTLAQGLPWAGAVAAWLEGDLAAAAAALAGADGQEPLLLALRARVALAQGDAAGALVSLDRALAIEPKGGALQLLRAEALAARGRWAEAATAISLAEGAGARGPIPPTLRASAAKAKGNAAGTLDAASEALKADPAYLPARKLWRAVK